MEEKRLWEADFERMVNEDPERLIGLLKDCCNLEKETLSNVQITFAAEWAGHLPSEMCVPVLINLLNHPSSLAREGVLYGLSNHNTEEVRDALKRTIEIDLNKTIRDMAREILEEFEEENKGT